MTAATIIFIFAVMFALNYEMPLHRDDYDYSMIWKTGEHINSLSDVFDSTYKHYLLHGGRAVTVFCLGLFLWLGKLPFDVVNAGLFTLLVVLIYFHARRSLKIFDEPGILAATGILAWLSFPHFGEVAIWKSGSTVYLWSGVIAAIFLLPYNLKLSGALKIGDSKIFAAGMFLLGILAGCSVENLGLTVTVVSGGIAIYFFNKNKFHLWTGAGAFGSLLGLIALIAAPGNYVRYDDQNAGKGILNHIGNQFAGNGEMLLYLLPVILILFCAVGILKSHALGNAGTKNFDAGKNFSMGNKILAALLAIFIFSYFNDGMITGAIKNFFIDNVFPALKVSVKATERFDNFMTKSEEFIIYFLILFLIFAPLRKSLGLVGKNLKSLNEKISLAQTVKKFPELRYPIFLFALALLNNFVMILAPTFPARATFGSVIMILAGAISILRLAPVRKKLSEGVAGKILKCGAIVIGGFTIISALVITNTLRHENDLRIEKIRVAANAGEKIVTFPPIELKNRALRHVFFVDFDNGVTKDGLCEFYGIKNIEVK